MIGAPGPQWTAENAERPTLNDTSGKISHGVPVVNHGPVFPLSLMGLHKVIKPGLSMKHPPLGKLRGKGIPLRNLSSIEWFQR
jgi:hypothetical protein